MIDLMDSVMLNVFARLPLETKNARGHVGHACGRVYSARKEEARGIVELVIQHTCM